MFSLAVYVTSRYKAYSEFSEYMDGCIKKFIPVGKPSVLISGDFKSNKSGNGLVARYAFEHNIPFRKFATLWGKHNPTKPGKRNNAGVASNAQIVKNCNGAVLFWTPTSIAKWDFMSGGCRSFERMCDSGHFARPLIKIKVDIYKPIDEEPPIPKEQDAVGDIATQSPEIGGGSIDIPSSRGSISAPTPSFTGGGGMSIPSGGSSGIPSISDINQSSDIPNADIGSVGSNSPSSEITGSDNQTDMIGNIDYTGGVVNTANSLITNVPLDLDGNGTPDVEVSAMDTNKDGVPDSIVTPIDADNNGTIDGLKLDPIPTAGQIVGGMNQQPQSAAPVASQQPPSQQVSVDVDDETKKSQNA